MKGINKVIIVGTLGHDPEFKTLTDGTAVATLSIATNESYKDKKGELVEKTEWHRVVLYARLAEIAGEYLKKGKQCYIEGSITYKKWQDKEGKDCYQTEIKGKTIQLLGSKESWAEHTKDEYVAPLPISNAKSVSALDDDIPF
jgi:single-strand DNA-binding protein